MKSYPYICINKKKDMNDILEALTLDSTYEHLVSCFGEDDIDEYFDWLYKNWRKIDMTGYGDISCTDGVIEDMYGMFLLDTPNYQQYLKYNEYWNL
jgi:hypothetical protein